MSRILKTAYLSGSQVVTTLSTLIIAAVLSRVLESKADYGTYQQTLLVYTFLARLLALGLPAASFYFCSKKRNFWGGSWTIYKSYCGIIMNKDNYDRSTLTRLPILIHVILR